MPDSALFLFDQESSMHFPIESKALRAGAHCGGKEDVAKATHRRRRILSCRILFYISDWQMGG